MIKEIGHTYDDNGQYKFGAMNLIDQIADPYDKNIPFSKWNSYFKEELDKLGIIKVKRRTVRFKNADWIQLYTYYPLMCVSKEFKAVFEGKLKGYWYPTTDKHYYLFLLDNYINPFDMNKTIIKYEDGNPNNPWTYLYIENEKFKKEVENNEYLFKITEEHHLLFCTPKFEKFLDEHGLTGFQVYKKINFVRQGFKQFDKYRSKKYDKDGNAI